MWNQVGLRYGEGYGRGFRIGNTCTPVVDSGWCMAKPIQYCKVKFKKRSINTDKASGGVGIPVELFQIMKDDAVKVLHSIGKQIWKTQPQNWKRSVFIPIPKKANAKECSNNRTIVLISGHRTRKGQFSFQSQRKAMPKNPQTTAQLHSSHTLVK